jgi:hypothetical protein
MKRNIAFGWYLLLAVPLFFSISGCKKFLDRKPLTATLEDLNQGALEGQVLGMYNILRTYAGFSSLPWVDFHSIRDDDAKKGSDASDGAEINAEFDSYLYAKDDWAPNTYWNDHYAMINAANDALHAADSLKVTDESSLRNVGEACFFRAYAYFELVKTYGEVPLINFKIVDPAQGIQPKATVERLYEFIDSNLQVAAQYLPLTWEVEDKNSYPGRLTKGAANTLWAQTYLFRKNWAQVAGLCNQVIASGQYSLASNFSDIWRDGLNGNGKNNSESIWEMQADVKTANGDDNSPQYNGSAWGTCQQVRQNGAPLVWNLGWGWNVPTDKLVNDWSNDDPRKSQTVLYSGQYDGGTPLGGFGAILPPYTNPDGTGGLAQKYWNKKLYTGNSPEMRSYTGYTNKGGAGWINHRILRYADVILMLAEASNELGDGTTAAANLELIRNRASGNLGMNRTVIPYIPFVDQAQMRAAIKNERRWEFALEGYRFYDLVRWDDALNVLGPLGYTNRCRYYPIPQKAIDLSNGVLKQNPEW